MNEKLEKVINKIKDHMLLGSVYDNIMELTKYRDPMLKFRYNVMVAQKHRMLYYKSLKKKYLKRCTAERPWESMPKKDNNDVIWFMWLQGIENAPLLVKRCYESLKKNIPDKKVIVLDEKNMSEYVELPDYIVKKWKSGIIGNAHFADMVRLELLIRHGGYWIDTTVLCTDSSILKEIDNTELFMYSFYYFGFNPEIMTLNNWFMKSNTNNNILCLMRKFLYEYWKDMDRAVNYFIFMIFMTIAVEYYEQEYSRMPIVSQVDSHVLASYIYSRFNQNSYDLLKKTTGFHKLSTRFNKDWIRKGSYYDVIINQGKY